MNPLVLVIPGRPMNANDRAHWRVKARQTAAVRRDAAILARATWGPARTRRAALTWPVTITVQDQCRTGNLRDTVNAAPSVKAIIDGLVDYGLLPDDGPAHVGEYRWLPATKTGQDALEITITSASE